MALLDLWFAEDNIKRGYNCQTCRKNPSTALQRRCDEEGFNNLKKPRRPDDKSLEYAFCPAKATWYPEIVELFTQCRIAMETGIMPQKGSFEEQPELFVEVFPDFVVRWKDRQYTRIWTDVAKFVSDVLEKIFSKK